MTPQEKVHLNKLHDKYYGAKARNHADAQANLGTRANLMQEAKTLGIKNYRILNKAELERIVDPECAIEWKEATIKAAKARWQAGWGKRKAVANA